MSVDRARPANSFVGSPIERIEDLRFLRGKGQYVDDISPPGLLHAVILRSAVAHGRIREIDRAAALARPGVHAVITAADIGNIPTIPLRQEQLAAFKPFEQPVIAVGKVRRADIACEFQHAVVDVLVAKAIKALDVTRHARLVVAGGVGANRELRGRIKASVTKRGERSTSRTSSSARTMVR